MNNKILKIIFVQILLLASILISTKVQATTTLNINGTKELLDAISNIKKLNNEEDYEIILEKNTYNLDKNIAIPKNTYINLNNNTISFDSSTAKYYAFYIAPEVSNVKIENGRIDGGGIYGNNVKNLECKNLKIINCEENGIYISNKSTLIKFSKLYFNNNVANGIYVVDSNIEILEEITNIGGLQGIYVKDSTANNINGCSLSGFSSNGIRLNNAKVQKIFNNTIETNFNADTRGIYVSDGSTTKDISNNKISLCNHGIFIRKSTVNGSVYKNSIEKTRESALQLFTKGIVTGKINNNSILNTKGIGIILTGPTKTTEGSTSGNIENNTIKNCTGDGIAIYHGSHCGEIIKNVLEKIGGNHNGGDGDYAIIVDSNMKANTYCTRIAENTIKDVTYAGIAIYSGPAQSLDNKFQDTAYVEKNIEKNTLNNCGTYKNSKDWKTEIAAGGKQGCLSGIYIDTHARVKGDICNNTVDKTGEHGVYIHLCSYVKSINNNTIKNCKEVGVEIYRSTVLSNIENNKIINSGTDGIAIAEYSKVNGNVIGNTIEATGEAGVYLKTSTLSKIQNNVMKAVKTVGIYLNEKSNINDIIANTISMNNSNDGFGIKVIETSKIKNIKNNTISGKMTYGIRIMGLKENAEISNNSISTNNETNKDFSAVYLIGNASNKFNVKNNKVIGNKTRYGIRVLQGKADILNNTVQKTFYPVYIEKNNFDVKIKDNKFSSNTKNQIKTSNKSYSNIAIKLNSVKAEKGAKVKLSYKASTPINKFEIYQATDKNGNYKKVKTVKTNSYKSSKLKANKKYFYKVCGFIKNGKISIYANMSNIKSVKTKK